MHSTSRFPAFGLALALLGACSVSQAPSAVSPAAPAASAATDPAHAAALPHAGAVRSVKVVKDPAPGAKSTIAHFWNYGRDIPFQINNYTAVGSAQPGPKNAKETKLNAFVQLPNLTGAKPFRLSQADATASAAAAETEDDMPEDEVAQEDAGDVDTGAESTADLMAEDTEDQDEALLGEDMDLPSPQQAAAVLDGPHEVEVTVEDDAEDGSTSESATYTDKLTGQSFDFALDRTGETLTLTNEAGSITFGGTRDTMTVDGQSLANAKAAVSILENSPVMQAMSPYALSLLVARLERRAVPAAPSAHRSLALFSSFQVAPTSAISCGRDSGAIVGYIKVVVLQKKVGNSTVTITHQVPANMMSPAPTPVPTATPKLVGRS